MAPQKIKPSSSSKIDNPQIVLETTLGKIRLELFKDQAPVTVNNFLHYVDDKFYDGTLFHRVIAGFMIQGGGFGAGMKHKETRPPISNEADNGVSNLRGTIAMARTQVVDSATSEFFINLVDNTYLDHRDETAAGFGYCVFGRVLEGMEVVDMIAKVPTGSFQYFQDVPEHDVVIQTIQRLDT